MDDDPEFSGPHYYIHYKGWKRRYIYKWVIFDNLLISISFDLVGMNGYQKQEYFVGAMKIFKCNHD
jgi:hypothetical protein